MKLDNLEKEFVEKIVAVSGKDKNTVKDILKAILIASTLEIYAAINEEEQLLVIPYLCKCKVQYFDTNDDNCTDIKVLLDAEPSQALIEEISNISEGNLTPSEKFVRRQIVKNVQNILDLKEVEVELDDELVSM